MPARPRACAARAPPAVAPARLATAGTVLGIRCWRAFRTCTAGHAPSQRICLPPFSSRTAPPECCAHAAPGPGAAPAIMKIPVTTRRQFERASICHASALMGPLPPRARSISASRVTEWERCSLRDLPGRSQEYRSAPTAGMRSLRPGRLRPRPLAFFDPLRSELRPSRPIAAQGTRCGLVALRPSPSQSSPLLCGRHGARSLARHRPAGLGRGL